MDDPVKIEDKEVENRELQDLWDQYIAHKGIESRNEIVLKYMWLVKTIAFKFRGSYSNFGQLDDMINQGIIALIDSVEKYDPEFTNKFESFAALKIKGAIIDFIRKQDWIPRNQRTLAKELDQVYGELYAQLGREPEREEIAQRMDISLLHLDKILHQRHNAIILSYEEVINEKMMVASPLISETQNDGTPESELVRDELKSKLMEAIDMLNDKERLVVTLYYYEELKLKEIAEVIGVTESRVSQIHSAAIIKMKGKLNKY